MKVVGCRLAYGSAYVGSFDSVRTVCACPIGQLEPVMWNIFVDLSGDPLAKEVQIAVAELWQLW